MAKTKSSSTTTTTPVDSSKMSGATPTIKRTNTTTLDDHDASPDSIPSVAETSVASSTSLSPHAPRYEEVECTTNDEDKDVTPRRLFWRAADESPLTNHDQQHHPYVCQFTPSSPAGEISNAKVLVYGSEVGSTTSSDTTVVASRNLSMKEDDDDDDDDDSEVYCVPPTTPMDNDNDNDNATHTRPHMTVEEPSAASQAAACNGALSLTPGQLAEIFVALQGGGGKQRKMWWSSSKKNESSSTAAVVASAAAAAADDDEPKRPNGGSDSTTPIHDSPPKTAREDLLLRECAALKEIIQEDCLQMVQLKQRMEAQQETMSLKEMETKDRSVELDIANERIDALKKEKEVLCEREQELLETILILKIEVDRLATLEGTKKDAFHHPPPNGVAGQGTMSKDCDESSILPNDPDASELSKLRSDLEAKEQENVQLRAQADYFKASLECRTRRDVEETSSTTSSSVAISTSSSAAEIAAVSAALKGISKRLEAVEKKKQDIESNRLMEASLEQNKNVEINEIRERLHLEDEDGATTTTNVLKISQDPDEIEALLPKSNDKIKMVVEQPMSPSRDASGCCCAAWSSELGME